MPKIVRLSENDLVRLIKRVLKEDMEIEPTMINVPRTKVEVVQQALVDAGYDVGPTGVDGKFGKNTRAAVIKFQKDNGIKQTGNVGPVTGRKLGVQPLTSGKPATKKPIPAPIVKDKEKTITTKKPTTPLTANNFKNLKISSQVKSQLDYMKSKGYLSDEKFTILDDKNSQVHAFSPGYKLFHTYYVITGRDSGDQLKTQSMGDWVKKNWKSVFSKLWKTMSPQDAATYADNCYFGQKEWRIKNTPSGVFKRGGVVENFLGDLLATTFMEEDYGSRFISWETCEGKTIPFGFHGTKNQSRLPVLNSKDINSQACSKRKMSFGCINFNNKDVQHINNFIDSRQVTIWLPDATNGIVEIPRNCLSGGAQSQISAVDQYRMDNKYYTLPGKI